MLTPASNDLGGGGGGGVVSRGQTHTEGRVWPSVWVWPRETGGGGWVGLNLASKPDPAYGKEKGSGHIRPGQNVDLTNQKR